jgi:hypothetical protein
MEMKSTTGEDCFVICSFIASIKLSPLLIKECKILVHSKKAAMRVLILHTSN